MSKTCVLIGSPNSGKTTLFNRLTGLRAKTVNYPGSTVELLTAAWGRNVLIDTPGIYSLLPRSPDEEITLSVLTNSREHLISVVDATQLSRQLALVLQLKTLGYQPIVLLTMLDLLGKDGESVDLLKLEQALGLKVVSADQFDVEIFDRHDFSKTETDSSTPSADRKVTDRNITDGEVRASLAEALRIKNLVIRGRRHEVTSALGRTGPRGLTRRLDQVALHTVFGPILFFGVMIGLFTSIYWLAQPLMEAVDSGFSFLSEAISTAPFLDPDSLWTKLVTDGLISGLSAVLVFVPQIFILFCGLIFLEDSGYLARAAVIVDKPLRAMGLGGRSFVPLLSGFSCAVPAMMAARTISSRRERLLTVLVLPLMSCSARLPVYALLLGLLFSDQSFKAGLGLALLYVLSLFIGLLAARVLSKIADLSGYFGRESSFLLMELPIYRRPRPGLVFKQALLRTKSYVKKIGPVILVLSVLIWGATTFPHRTDPDEAHRLETSFAGQAGQFISPIFEPMGGDWRTGLGLISAFAAREVFVSTMAVIFRVTDVDGSQDLTTRLREAKAPDGRPLFTLASTLGLMLFFVIALQCLATVAVALKESNSWKFAVFQLLLFNTVAYVAAVVLVQGLRSVGIS